MSDNDRVQVLRFADLPLLDAVQNSPVPEAALDLIYARKIWPLIAPAGMVGPFAAHAPLTGDRLMVSFVSCPPGQGPSLHAHHKTEELFICLQGTFEIRWGEAGQHYVLLKPLDSVAVPPGVFRCFKNVGDQDAYLQVIITGGINDPGDILFPEQVKKKMSEISPDAVEKAESIGFSFREA